MPIVYNRQSLNEKVISVSESDKVSPIRLNKLTLANFKFLKSLGYKINKKNAKRIRTNQTG